MYIEYGSLTFAFNTTNDDDVVHCRNEKKIIETKWQNNNNNENERTDRGKTEVNE